MAAMSGAWLRKKVRHPWLGGPRRLTMYLATLDCATSNPSETEQPDHSASLGDSITSSTRIRFSVHTSRRYIFQKRASRDIERSSLQGVHYGYEAASWTATEIYRLKGLAKKKLEVTKIARSLKRTTAATVLKARSIQRPWTATSRT
jgi:hypothetical protein